MRLDRWFRVHFPDVSYGLSAEAAALRPGARRLQARAGQRAAEAGQQVRVPAVVRQPPKPAPSLQPPLGLSKGDRDFIERMILFEDEHVLVLNKPFGIAVQGGTGTKRHIDGMLAGMADRFGDRPRLVHRLDRDTTGVLLVAKNRDAAAKLGRIFQTRSAAKTYWALVKGVPKPPQGKVEAALVKAAGPDGEPRAQGAAGRAGQGHARHHALLGDRPRGAQGVVGVAEARHRPPAPVARAHGADRPPDRRRQQVRGRQGLLADSIEAKLHLHARRLVIPHPAGGQDRRHGAAAPHMAAPWELLGLDIGKFD